MSRSRCARRLKGCRNWLTPRKNRNSIVQVGMQRRSYDLYLEGRKIVAEGTLGNGPDGSFLVAEQRTRRSRGDEARRASGLGAVAGSGRKATAGSERFRNWRCISDYAGGIVADQGAHVYDGIHLLMNASYPLARDGLGREAPQGGVDTAGVGGGDGRVSGRLYRRISDQLRRHAVSALRNDQMNHLDGDKARMDIGREDYRVFREGAEDTLALENDQQKASAGRRICTSRIFWSVLIAQDTHSSDASWVPGSAGGSARKSVSEEWSPDGLERRSQQSCDVERVVRHLLAKPSRPSCTGEARVPHLNGRRHVVQLTASC